MIGPEGAYMNQSDLLNQMLESGTQAAIEGARGFAAYLSNLPVNAETLHMYLKVLSLNDKEVLDAVFKKRTPESLFSPVTPDRRLVASILDLLSSRRAGETDRRVVYACTGTLASVYTHPANGMKIHPLTAQELYHTAKYLLLQDETAERFITGIMEAVTALPSREYGGVSLVAAKIRDAALDTTKGLESVIPHGLLI